LDINFIIILLLLVIFRVASLKILSQKDLIFLFSFLYRHLHQLLLLLATQASLPFDSSFAPSAPVRVLELAAKELPLRV
jgi:hypothetical protein